MPLLVNSLGPVLIPALFGACFAGLAYVLVLALKEGSEAYADLYTKETARQLEDVFLFIPPDRVLDLAKMLAVAAFIIVFLLFGGFSTSEGLIAGTILGLIAGFAALNLPRWILGILGRRRLTRFNDQLVDALMSMSNSLKAGFSILQAFEAVVREEQIPISQEFGVFLQQTRVGLRFEDALREMEERVGSEDLTLMARAIETARQTGGNLTEVFEKIAATIRERIRIQGRVRSMTAQGRLQGIVVGSVPVLLLFVLYAMDPTMMRAFVGSRIGLVMLSAAVVLEVAGIFVIRRIIRIPI